MIIQNWLNILTEKNFTYKSKCLDSIWHFSKKYLEN